MLSLPKGSKGSYSVTHFHALIVTLSICVFDQLTKYFICSFSSSLPLYLTPFFNLVFTKNRGMSFGVFNNMSSLVFYGVTSVVIGLCAYLVYWLWKEKNKNTILSLSFILGGALGNLSDRFFRQGVVDFLDFHLQSYHWPSFNIADSFIFLGVLLLLWGNVKEKRTK
jgi:signal peptidase II